MDAKKGFLGDGRKTIHNLYKKYDSLKKDGWIKEKVFASCFEHDKSIKKLSCFSFRTKRHGKNALWIISGIHGEEPAGPNAIAESIEIILKIGKKIPVVLIPICNPSGYFRNWRYVNQKKYVRGRKNFCSVGDSEHFLIWRNKKPIRKQPYCMESDLLTRFVVNTAKKYWPEIMIDLHEDDLEKKAYTYSHGRHGHNDDLAKKIINDAMKHVFSIKNKGKTSLGERIVKGIAVSKNDKSIDELFASKNIFWGGKIRGGLNAKHVIVVESPAKNVELRKRIKMHCAVIALLKDILA